MSDLDAEQEDRATFENKTQEALDELNVVINEHISLSEDFNSSEDAIFQKDLDNAMQEVKENIENVAKNHGSLADQVSSLNLPNLKT